MAAIPEELRASYSAALTVHFLARRQENFLTPLATTLNEAAGTAGIHRWNLILPSSARVFLLTYQTVIGVRCHELVKFSAGEYISLVAFWLTFQLKEEAPFRFFGMPRNPILMRCKTLAWWWITSTDSSHLPATSKRRWRSCATKTDWFMHLVAVAGYKTPRGG